MHQDKDAAACFSFSEDITFPKEWQLKLLIAMSQYEENEKLKRKFIEFIDKWNNLKAETRENLGIIIQSNVYLQNDEDSDKVTTIDITSLRQQCKKFGKKITEDIVEFAENLAKTANYKTK